MNEFVEQYLSFFGCKSAVSTTNRVKYQLYQFLRYLQYHNIGSFCELQTQHLIKWNESLRLRLHNRTISSQHASIKGLVDWLYVQGIFLVHPWPEYLEIKQRQSLPKAVPGNKEAVVFMGNMQGAIGNIHYPNRNRTIMELCYGSGLRRNELCGLNAGDIRSDWVKVTGKGGKERLVPLGSKTKTWLNIYLIGERSQQLKKCNPLEEALFLNRYGRRLSLNAYSYLVTHSKPKSTRWTFHSFRHACATHMLENGANIRVLQKLLGHKKLSSTQVYTKVEVSSLKGMLNKFHPRG
jgi:site-specific recombinase XerD